MPDEPLTPDPSEVAPTPHQPDTTSRRRRVAWVALVLVGVAVVTALALTQGRTTTTRTANRSGAAPPFRLDNLQPGQAPVTLETLRGKPVVVNFWASWCVPCRKEMPGFEAVHKALGNKVAFVGVNNKDYRDSALDFVQKTGVTYPSGFDQSGRVAIDYGVVGMPTTVFISPDGQLLESRTGEISSDELQGTISRLFGVS